MTIASPEAELLASEVAKETGETPAQGVIRALEERLARLRRERDAAKTLQVIMESSRRCGALPDLEMRSPDEVRRRASGVTVQSCYASSSRNLRLRPRVRL